MLIAMLALTTMAEVSILAIFEKDHTHEVVSFVLVVVVVALEVHFYQFSITIATIAFSLPLVATFLILHLTCSIAIQ